MYSNEVWYTGLLEKYLGEVLFQGRLDNYRQNCAPLKQEAHGPHRSPEEHWTNNLTLNDCTLY